MKIVAFSQYLAYNVGGAEKSMLEILKSKVSQNYQIDIISFRNKNKKFNLNNSKLNLDKSFNVILLDMLILPKFSYLEYFLNRKRLIKMFVNLSSNQELYTYALYYPVAINNFSGKSTLFIRCEHDLGLNPNYHLGIKYILKSIYKFIELPFFLIYKSDLKRAIKKADKIICNSNFTKDLLYKLYKVDSEVILPYVDKKRLLKEYENKKYTINDKGVVFVGDAIIKGLNTVKDIAKLMPNTIFYIFRRDTISKTKIGNIVYMPWQNTEADIYKYAKVVIVPSIWQEAYGRVSAEANILGIPVFVSNRGGLPQSINYKKEFIIDDYKNPNAWKKAIEKYV